MTKNLSTPDSSPARPIPQRARRKPLRTGESARKKLLNLLWEAQFSPLEMLEKVHLPPSHAHRILKRPIFKKAVEALASLSHTRQRLMHARGALTAIQRLTALANGEGETARKACMDLLSLHKPAKSPKAAAPVPHERTIAPLEQRIDDLLGRLAEEQEHVLPTPDLPAADSPPDEAAPAPAGEPASQEAAL